jgi:hypothetical protein
MLLLQEAAAGGLLGQLGPLQPLWCPLGLSVQALVMAGMAECHKAARPAWHARTCCSMMHVGWWCGDL